MEVHLNKLIQVSSNLIEQLKSGDLTLIDEQMERRNELFHELQQFIPSSAQKQSCATIINQLQAQDREILKLMKLRRAEANEELNKLNRGKQSKSMYETSSNSDDSLFFDTRR